jgi:DNA-binding transcriptional ArsR family regulator/archaellum biogenesis ATPase FlaH
LGDVQRQEIPIYKYQEIQEANAAGKTIFIAEGEPACDAFWELGIPATTNIGGAGKWQPSDSKDLAGAKIVLCPDRDKPGVKHTEKIATDFPHAQWLYVYPDSPLWNNLPDNQGLDLVDWLEDRPLSHSDLYLYVEPRRSLPQSEPAFQEKGKTSSEITFTQMLEEYNEIQKLPCPGERYWLLIKLAKRCKMSVAQLIKTYDEAFRNRPIFEGMDIQELLSKTPERFNWLVAGLMPMGSTALLYAEAGTGKTLLVNGIIKAVAGSENWNGYPTQQGKVLYIQTDEPEVNTAHNLKEAGFESIPPENLTIFFKWQFSQMAQLREKIAAEQPKLVVIDSLTSSNRATLVEEKSVEYARGLYELRDMAMEFGCAIIVLHHENKNGGVRGTTAIKANVSEVWHLKRCDKLSANHRLLEIEKSRAGCTGTRQLELNVDDLSWDDQGEYEASGKGGKPGSNGARLLNFLQSRPGVKFEVDELVGEFGSSRDAVRVALSRLFKAGLIDCESRVKTLAKGNGVRYKVYFAPELFSVTETVAPSGVGTLNTTLNTPLNTTSVQGDVQREKANDSKGFSHAEQNSPQTQANFYSHSEPTATSSQARPIVSSDSESTATAPTAQFQVGSRVASRDSQQVSYNWHGTIARFRNGGADVRWDERQGMKGGEVLWHRLEDLRLL